MDGIETRFNRIRHVNDEPNDIGYEEVSTIFPKIGRPVGSGTTFMLDPVEKIQAHRYVLFNCREVEPFLEYVFKLLLSFIRLLALGLILSIFAFREFKLYVKRRIRSRTRSSVEFQKIVSKDFADWFARRVSCRRYFVLKCTYILLHL